MMKIKVGYQTIVEEVIEVDEKFYRLAEPGGWNEMSIHERERLSTELLNEITDRIDAGFHDIIYVEEYGTEELMYEN